MIGFRLNKADGAILLSRAKQLKVSVHEVARAYTQLALREREERIAVRDALEKLQHQVAALRKDVLVATAVLLSSAGEVEPDEAGEWVKKNLGDA